jgi:hypothetical protein
MIKIHAISLKKKGTGDKRSENRDERRTGIYAIRSRFAGLRVRGGLSHGSPAGGWRQITGRTGAGRFRRSGIATDLRRAGCGLSDPKDVRIGNRRHNGGTPTQWEVPAFGFTSTTATYT